MGNDLAFLEREMYTEVEASRLLRVAQSTLHYWLEGGQRRGTMYAPIIREMPTGSRVVTWAEFVEAGLLREYRRTHQIPMVKLRDFISKLRSTFGVPYPLAHERPLVSGRELVAEIQAEVGLDSDYWLVVPTSNQFLLTPPGESFVRRVRWADDVAVAWRPHLERGSSVLIDPDVRFGRPAVAGISTETIWELTESGSTTAEMTEIYGLASSDIRWALAYENATRAA